MTIGLVDEIRKLLVVREIIDATHFTGVWRGQAYECRALPDTSLLAAGDVAFCHVLPGNTELVAVFPPSGELWFSPGAINYEFGELWKYTGSGVATLTYTCTNIYEHITHLAWCQGDGKLYMFTYQDNSPTWTIRVYCVNRPAGTCTLITSVSRTKIGALDPRLDPVIDSAEFGTNVYILCGAYFARPCEVYRFNYAAGTLALVLDVTAMGAAGFGGGIAVMGGNLLASDGNSVYVSATGDLGSWAFDFDLTVFNAVDNACMFTNRDDDDLAYHGNFYPVNPGDPEAVKRTGAGVWVADLDEGAVSEGVVNFTQEHTAGVPTALWAQNWADGAVWSKAAGGGAWAMDWAGPGAYFGLTTQGLVLFKAKIYGMWADNTQESLLYRRDGPGVWVLIQSWDATYQRVPTTPTVGAMCAAPNSYRLCHEC